MKEVNGEILLTLKEASEKYNVPTYWVRRQIGKKRLPNGRIVRHAKFPSDRNYYVYQSEVEELAKPLIFDPTYNEESQKKYEQDPEYDVAGNVPDFAWPEEK